MTVQGGFSEEFSDEFETDETYYVTLDERVYDVASGATRGEFSNDYSSDFTVPRLQSVNSAISSYERPSSSRITKTFW